MFTRNSSVEKQGDDDQTGPLSSPGPHHLLPDSECLEQLRMKLV